MIREAFKVTSYGLGNDEPKIYKVEITDPQGVSWREAKKHLRQYYLDRAANLRSITQKDYFGA